MTNVRRDVKEAKVTREGVFAELANVDLTHLNLEFVGRGKDGLVYRNTEDGLFVEVMAVAKQPNFDGDLSVELYEESQQKEEARVQKRKADKAEKEAKRLAREAEKLAKENEKAEAEVETENEGQDAEDEDEEGESESPQDADVQNAEAVFQVTAESFIPEPREDVAPATKPAGRERDEVNGTTPVEL